MKNTKDTKAAMDTRATAIAAVVVSMLFLPAAALAQGPSSSDNYDELFARYLNQARTAEAVTTPGGNWSWMNGLALDLRARNINDLITIRVAESITASGSADSALSKDGKAAVGLPSFFGLEKKLAPIMDPASLVAGSSSTDFKGGGTTNRAGELTALVTARVIEVLPSGDLVIEGVREITINGDRQIVVLSGVVRVADITPNNIVRSTSIGQMRIRYFGKGLMKDNLNPGWLVRILNKVF